MSGALQGVIVPHETPLHPEREVVVGIFVGGPKHGETTALPRDMHQINVAHAPKIDWSKPPEPDEGLSFTQSYYLREEWAWGRLRRLRIYVHQSLGSVRDPEVSDLVGAMLFDMIIHPKYQAARTL